MKEAKRDKCGVRMDLILGDVLLEIGRGLARGAEKYSDNNWQESRLNGEHGPVNHALKHIVSYQAGVPDDEGDDPKIHLTHAIMNLMFELYYEMHPKKYAPPEQPQKRCTDCGRRGKAHAMSCKHYDARVEDEVCEHCGALLLLNDRAHAERCPPFAAARGTLGPRD